MYLYRCVIVGVTGDNSIRARVDLGFRFTCEVDILLAGIEPGHAAIDAGVNIRDELTLLSGGVGSTVFIRTEKHPTGRGQWVGHVWMPKNPAFVVLPAMLDPDGMVGFVNLNNLMVERGFSMPVRS